MAKINLSKGKWIVPTALLGGFTFFLIRAIQTMKSGSTKIVNGAQTTIEGGNVGFFESGWGWFSAIFAAALLAFFIIEKNEA